MKHGLLGGFFTSVSDICQDGGGGEGYSGGLKPGWSPSPPSPPIPSSTPLLFRPNRTKLKQKISVKS